MLPASNSEYFWNNDPFTRLFNQNFGTGLLSHHTPLDMPSLPNSYWNRYPQPRRPSPPRRSESKWPKPMDMVPKEGSTASETGEGEGLWTSLNLDRDKFEVKLDVHQFLPEEIRIQVQDKHVIIEGSHEEKADPHGFISRNFTRRYALPENVKMEHILCKLSSDGILIITAPRVEIGDENKFLPIIQTRRPAMIRGHSGVHASVNMNDVGNPKPGLIRSNANVDIHGAAEGRCHTPHCQKNHASGLNGLHGNFDIHSAAYGRGHTDHCEQNDEKCMDADSCEVKV